MFLSESARCNASTFPILHAAFKHLASQNESVQVWTLKIMLEATGELAEVLALPELIGAS